LKGVVDIYFAGSQHDDTKWSGIRQLLSRGTSIPRQTPNLNK
jgi:hypothetical protein